MALFSYKAISTAGDVITGEMQGETRQAVITALQDKGLLPVDAEEVRNKKIQKTSSARSFSLPFVRQKAGVDQLTIMTRELANMVRAGVTLERSLTILIDVTEHAGMREQIKDILNAIRTGQLLSEALEEAGKPFTPLYISMVRAGEVGGALPDVLSRLEEYLAKSQATRSNVKSALMYPMVLLGISVISLFLLMFFVVPQFEQLFRGAADMIPDTTKMVISMSHWLSDYWLFLIMGLAGLFGVILYLLQWEPVAMMRDRFVLKIPLYGDLVRKIEAGRFCRTLGTLLKNGVPMLVALKNVSGILGNRVMALTVDAISGSLKAGDDLSSPLLADDNFPRLAVHMIRVGEETGRLEHMLEEIAVIYDEEVDRSIKRVLAILEPLLILVFGLLIGGIIISVLVGILSVNQLAF